MVNGGINQEREYLTAGSRAMKWSGLDKYRERWTRSIAANVSKENALQFRDFTNLGLSKPSSTVFMHENRSSDSALDCFDDVPLPPVDISDLRIHTPYLQTGGSTIAFKKIHVFSLPSVTVASDSGRR